MFDFFHIRCDFCGHSTYFELRINGFELINRYFAQICACIFTRTYLSNYVNHINVINWTICKLWSRIDLNTIRIFSFTQGTVGDYWFGAKQSPRNCANSRTYQCTQFPRKKTLIRIESSLNLCRKTSANSYCVIPAMAFTLDQTVNRVTVNVIFTWNILDGKYSSSR